MNSVVFFSETVTIAGKKYLILVQLLLIGLLIPTQAICRQLPKEDPYPAAKAPFYKLIEEGKSNILIVTGENPRREDMFAAEEIALYLEKISGAAVEVVTKEKSGLYPVYIGQAAQKYLNEVKWEKLGEQGFILKNRPEGLFIAGAEGLGTIYGVYQFLEKHLGIRWFMPGETGTVIPDNKTITIGTFNETEIPSFKIRWIEDGGWALHNKMNVGVSIPGRDLGINWKWQFHTHFILIPPYEYYDQHPEWFAMNENGERPRPAPGAHGQQLCLSSEALIRETAKNIITIFDQDPGIDILSLAPQDGGGFCQCPKCEKLYEDRPENEAWHSQYSNILAAFNNRVASIVKEKYPDKLIKAGAYAMYLRVPLDKNYTPEKNLAIQVCHTYSCNNHPVESKSCHRNTEYFRKELQHWSKITDQLFIYEYYNKGAMGNLPYGQLHVIKHDIPYYRKLGAESFYTQPSKGHAHSCLNHYMAMKLTWNVGLSTEKLLQDFCEKFFEDAAPAMRGYFDSLELAYQNWGKCLDPFGYQVITIIGPQIFNETSIARMQNHLNNAETSANSEMVKKRIWLFRQYFEYAKAAVDYLNAIRAPFRNIDLKNEAAVKQAEIETTHVGEKAWKAFEARAKEIGVSIPERYMKVHNRGLRFLTDDPIHEVILR